MTEQEQLARRKAGREQSFEAHLAWLASRPRWASWGGSPQAADPKKRRAMEKTGIYLGERRDV